MHQAGKVRNGRWDTPVDEIIGEVEDGEPLEPADIVRNLARDLIANKIQDSEKGKRGDTRGDLARDALPISDNDRGKTRETTDGA